MNDSTFFYGDGLFLSIVERKKFRLSAFMIYWKKQFVAIKGGLGMIGKTRVMLYAEDVEILSRFFIEKLGATISETIDLPEACQSTIVTISS